ncbi:hypothetical protein M446_2278 [Methylobacterium sp. 4-46]|uniref:hypothetical protein n=1 Tax=unclassified Methylobacterium TaxID=2615210 RepID=UPI000152E959|nr:MULTISPECIES: hypothetical protein [Methylobacterium]ACA16738.1 hypothetical protein M446_2278 [Methylobacterium sp. 4-46]WFT82436.1 hypothetical protein QA634_11545 [Methylobacterium nodulans]
MGDDPSAEIVRSLIDAIGRSVVIEDRIANEYAHLAHLCATAGGEAGGPDFRQLARRYRARALESAGHLAALNDRYGHALRTRWRTGREDEW